MIHFALVQSNIIRNRLLCFNSHSHTTQSGLKHERRVLNFVYNFFFARNCITRATDETKAFFVFTCSLALSSAPKKRKWKTCKNNETKMMKCSHRRRVRFDFPPPPERYLKLRGHPMLASFSVNSSWERVFTTSPRWAGESAWQSPITASRAASGQSSRAFWICETIASFFTA